MRSADFENEGVLVEDDTSPEVDVVSVTVRPDDDYPGRQEMKLNKAKTLTDPVALILPEVVVKSPTEIV